MGPGLPFRDRTAGGLSPILTQPAARAPTCRRCPSRLGESAHRQAIVAGRLHLLHDQSLAVGPVELLRLSPPLRAWPADQSRARLARTAPFVGTPQPT